MADDTQSNFPIVALCASAGGLEAFQAFFKAMPVGSGMAFLVVQHQNPKAESTLHTIIQRHTSIPVQLMSEGTSIQPNTIYVLPVGKEVRIQHGQFQLSDFTQRDGWPTTIDHLLQTLAHDAGERVVAVILSGLGTDGTEGARAVKDEGGRVIAQDLDSTKQPAMPTSVIQSDLADVVLATGEIPAYLLNTFEIDVQLPPELQNAEDVVPEEELEKVIGRLRHRTGRDFEDYKTSTMRRQIARRIATLQLETLDAYLDYLDENPEEANHLTRYLLINVTNFFRDPEAFASLRENALLPLLREMSIDEVFRAWVPGCATGEEAVSLAIVIYECLRELDMPEMEVRIFASDANRELVQQARTGLYPASITEYVPENRLRDHFMEEDGRYRVRNHISRMIIWAEHNLVEHPPFSQLHLLSCRNVLIYFQRRLQDRIVSLFQFALRPDGILFLGSSETTPTTTEELVTLDSRHKIYRRTSGTSSGWLRLDQPLFRKIPDYPEELMPPQEPAPKGDNEYKLQVVKDMLVEHYAPTAVIVDDNHQIRYSFGEIDRYLRLIPGESVQRSVLEMSREGLEVDLTIALHEAFADDDATIRRDGVWVRTNGDERIINLVVKSIRDNRLGNRLKLVIFDVMLEGRDLREREINVDGVDDEPGAIVNRLRQELEQTREVLQSTTQALQAKSEELTTSLEEIRSANEEIQTTNEELRTSKEELESMNEELNTLNTQLIDQNEELTRANNTLHNFMQATELAMIFLDQDLNIREFTPATTHIFGLRSEDRGRPLADISSNLDYDDLIADASSVLDTLNNVEKEVQHKGGQRYNLRMRPYRTTNNMIDGVVLTFSEIGG